MFKKIGLAFAAIVVAMSMVVSSASAATGWQTIYQFPVTNFDSASVNYRTSGIFYEQDGGNLAVHITDHIKQSSYPTNDSAFMEIWLYEDDGDYNAPDLVGYWKYFPAYYGASTMTPYVENVQNYRDGTNNEAELYIKLKSNYDSSDFYVKVLD